MSIEMRVPEVGESVTEVYIGEWRKSVGDDVQVDEEIVELESDKATFDAPAPVSGVLVEILKQAGDKADVGEVIARIDPAGVGNKSQKSKKADSTGKGSGKSASPSSAKRVSESRSKQDKSKKEKFDKDTSTADGAEADPLIMPAAWRALQAHGLDPQDVTPSGPGGRMLKEDVLRHVEDLANDDNQPGHSQQTATQDLRQEEAVRLSPIRRRIAERLVSAQQQAALLTTFNEVDMSAVKSLRKQYQEAFQKRYNVKLGFMSFFVKAAVEALQEIPTVNAELRDDEIVYRNFCDISIAIGGGKGLVVPVLRNAEQMSFAQIEQTIDDFSRRAQSNELTLAELRGGTFTISNGGIYGSLMSTPIVNPPQSGVLGMHSIQDRPVVRNGEIVARPMMYLALTYDHRIIDGREAVTFLRLIKERIEDPTRLLIEV